jgi:hypothetical protein
VFGLRFKDLRQFMAQAENELVYVAGKVVVLYDLLSHHQRYYQGHINEVISVAVEGLLCASGELASVP